MKNFRIMDGNHACAYVSYKMTELAGIYPITPASTMAEHIDKWSSNHEKNFFNDEVKVVEMQSEAGAIAMVHGALQSGVLSSTYTASQGLLLMIPNMYKIAGELLPGVINVAARSISTHALSIFCDHQDVYAVRQTGTAILFSSSVQQVMDLTPVSYLSALKGSIPFINAFDGFRTSHELQKISVIDLEKVRALIDEESLTSFRARALNPNKKITRGTAQNDDVYFQNMEVRNKYYDALPNIVENYMNEINKITGQDYKLFNFYGETKATKVIVAMGSVCETIKETVDYLNEQNNHVGLIEVHLYRPFSIEHILKVLPDTVKKIAVLDRTKESGSSGEPLYLDVVNALKDKDIDIIGGRYGISSKDVSPKDINAVFEYLDNNKKVNGFTVGILDDVTNKSIEVDDTFHLPHKTKDMLIYGYGSDGMVSASKTIMKIVGEQTEKYVQGYFQYDSKKSGGVTKSHLRIGDDKIRSSYYIDSSKLLVCTKASYLTQFNMIDYIEDNGIFILNSALSDQECLNLIPSVVKKKMIEKNISFYIADACSLSMEYGLGNKISTIMETIIMKFLNIMEEDKYKNIIKKKVEEEFSTKGKEIVDANNNVIDKALGCIRKVDVKNTSDNIEEKKYTDDIIIDSINKMNGNALPTSAFLNHADGTYQGGNTVFEKRKISEYVPVWIKENCIQCNQCSFVCPHAVIRPFLLDEEENEKVKDNSIKAIGPDLNNYNFMIGVSYNDCTGCTHCVQTCPGMKGKKALEMVNIHELKQKEQDDYLFEKVTNKNIERKNNVKYSQFQAPKFEYPGSCSGCGETPYLKVLTQIFGNNLIIANATGCSSIYGASLPSTPYSVPWINSLFEDNAEVGYGIYVSHKLMRNRVKNIIEDEINNVDDETKKIYKEFIDNFEDMELTNKLASKIRLTSKLEVYKEYLVKPTIWCIGGDGWAYDIGYSGIDHILSSNENINILVLDTEVYSNTGGQSSKSSRTGSVASFTESGKKTVKKDLAKIAMTHENVFVAQISLGYNKESVVKIFEEAAIHDGPSIVIAYAPCISHGIKGGMKNALYHQKLAGECGYLPIFKYHNNTLTLYNKNPDFNKYKDFLELETRYSMLKMVNEDQAEELLNRNREIAEKRHKMYKDMSENVIIK